MSSIQRTLEQMQSNQEKKQTSTVYTKNRIMRIKLVEHGPVKAITQWSWGAFSWYQYIWFIVYILLPMYDF